MRPQPNIHAADRAAERMGCALSVEDLNAMAAMCRDGQSFRLRDRRSGGEQHVVVFKAKSFRLVYDRDSNRVITVLDPIGKPRRKHQPHGKRS